MEQGNRYISERRALRLNYVVHVEDVYGNGGTDIDGREWGICLGARICTAGLISAWQCSMTPKVQTVRSVYVAE